MGIQRSPHTHIHRNPHWNLHTHDTPANFDRGDSVIDSDNVLMVIFEMFSCTVCCSGD